jgi:hypothetical protein
MLDLPEGILRIFVEASRLGSERIDTRYGGNERNSILGGYLMVKCGLVLWGANRVRRGQATTRDDWFNDPVNVEARLLARAKKISRIITLSRPRKSPRAWRILASRHRRGLKPCKRCGTDKRFVSDGTCVKCRQNAWRS